ncbi:MAG TPA: HEAT repeat domain-containing protein, partial [Myxococcota bacterium]
MRDVRIWQVLHGDSGDVDELVTLLDDLAGAPREKRARYTAPLVPLLSHRAPRVRAASVAALGGVLGHAGKAALANALDDNHASVRLAAVHALADSCTHDGAPFLCALYHRRVDVRRLALSLCTSRTGTHSAMVARVPVAHVALLLGDKEHAADVRAVFDGRAADGAIVPGLMVARRHGFLDEREAIARLLAVPFAEKSSEVFAAMPFAAAVDAHVATADALRGYLTSLAHSDPLADALALLWQKDGKLSDDAPIVERFIKARRANQLKDPEHRRLAVCTAQVMLTRAESSPRMLALTALSAPALILVEGDSARRRAALRALPSVAGHDLVGKGVTLKLLVDKGAFKDHSGELDAAALAGGLRLLFDAP